MYARNIEISVVIKDSYAYSKDPRSSMDFRAAVSVVSILLEFLNKTIQSTDVSVFARFILAYAMETNFNKSFSSSAIFLEHLDGMRIDHFNDGNGPWQPRGTLFCQLRLNSFARLPWANGPRNTRKTPWEPERPAKAISFHRYLVAGRHIREKRRCLGLLHSTNKRAPGLDSGDEYVIVRLNDGDEVLKLHGEPFAMDYVQATPSIRRCEPGAGIVMFQRVIWVEVDSWAAEWRDALELIDKTFNIPVFLPNVMFTHSSACALQVHTYMSLRGSWLTTATIDIRHSGHEAAEGSGR